LIDINKAIPHREPFLFVDSVTDITETTISTEKVVDKNMDLFRGHYPDFPILPGVIVCEAIFQAGAILLSRSEGDLQGKMPVVAKIRSAKFRRMVRPGDRLAISASIEEKIGNAYYMKGRATVKGKSVANVSFTCALTDKPTDEAEAK
jgi:3-hydroxyacyl-[acyl-carrier-protein] dehydratase